MERLFFTPSEDAEELGISTARVRHMILAGDEVSTVTDALDDDAPSAATLQRIGKKATTKASKR